MKNRNCPRQLFLDTLFDFYVSMGQKSFWKDIELQNVRKEGLFQDYLRVDHGENLDKDAKSLEAAMNEYEHRMLFMKGKLKNELG